MISSGIQSICVIVCYTYSYRMYMCEYGNVAMKLSQQRSESMPNECMKLSTESLHPLYFQQLVEWATRLQLFTRDSQMEFPGRSKNNTRLSWDGSIVIYHLQFSAPPSYVFVEADFLTTFQSVN